MGARFGLAVIVVFAVAVAAGAVAAKSQGSFVAAPAPPTVQPTPIPSPGPGNVLIIPDTAGGSSGLYRPASITVPVGQTVTWTNLDTTDHTVAADSGAFTSRVLARGQSFTWTPSKPGTYTYGDFLHSDMTGQVVVTR